MTLLTPNATIPAVEADGLWKRYGDRDVVRDVSLSLHSGEVLGMVGPNGSGKTTTIRMLLDITRPDRGDVLVFGRPMDEDAQERIGYLPEERGLYRDQRILPTLVYLAQLKGMSRPQAEARAGEVLDRLGMAGHQGKKVKELSRGMGQLIQFAATIMHRPDFIILDEPFSGLDPVNVRLMKDVVRELGTAGAGIMFSTHQMTDVEELCDRVVMVHQGGIVLDGRIADIKRRFAGDALMVACDPAPDGLLGATDINRDGDAYHMRLLPGVTPEALLRELLDSGRRIDSFQVASPSLEEVFLRMVAGESA